MKKILISIGVVLFIALLVAGVVWRLHVSPLQLGGGSGQTASGVPVDESGLGKSSGRDVPPNAAEYYNPYFNFSLLYPNILKPGEHPEGENALTVTFEEITPKTVDGFQIFIVPYPGGQITDARFKEDDPSGVRQNLKDIKVDGAVGAEFDSTDHILGATHEVWFIHGGYLYEVTTFKELGSWLDQLMTTWKFTP